MNKPRRDNLRCVVGEARRIVEESLKRQLLRYGLSVDDDPVSLPELSIRSDEEQHYVRVLDALRREGRATGRAGIVARDAVARYVREAGGTWINRLAAFRALEARGLLDPACALVGDEYGGLSPRATHLRERAAEAGERLSADDALRHGLMDGCRELSASVRVLFDLADEQSLFWPDPVALRALLQLLSNSVTVDDWREPDILGWVYQYYNTDANAELKKRKNKTTGFKYQPDDIPIANQYYTPHWVVRVLADNTLGRLWLEMQDRVPRLDVLREAEDSKTKYRLDERRVGVPHAASEPEEYREWVAEDSDPFRDRAIDRLCRFLVPLPSDVPPRAKKSVRDLRVLDPACGSGHFLLYAFDLLYAMYREEEPTLDPREIPSLILERNLFGVDIDLRAAQLAAFGLYMKARATLQMIDPIARLRLRRLNIVVADAHIDGDPRKDAFLDRHEGAVRTLYEKILADLDHTNVLGSLLKVRTEFERLVRPWAQPSLAKTGRRITVDELVAELRSFEEEVLPEQDIGARLFYTDLQRTVGLLGLLSQQYDVVLLNPPYGSMPDAAHDYLKGNKKKRVPAHYARTHSDLFAAFVEQAIDVAQPGAFIGCLVPWTYTFLSSHEELRTQILCGEARPELIQEYGYGILDGATVGTVATIVRKMAERPQPDHPCSFNRLSDSKKDWQKRDRFLATLPSFAAAGPRGDNDWFVAQIESLKNVPRMPFAYALTDNLRALFRRFPALDRDQEGALIPHRPATKVSDLRQGLATGDDGRFIRFWWEVPVGLLGQGRRWVPFAKGGKAIRFYSRGDVVVNWDLNGAEMKEYEKERVARGYAGRGTSALGKWPWFFQSGVTWPMTSWRLRRFGLHQSAQIFGVKACIAFPAASIDERTLLAYLNSGLVNALLAAIKPERDWPTGDVGILPIDPDRKSEKMGEIAEALVQINRGRYVGDETCRDFEGPTLLRVYRQTGTALGRLDLPLLLSTCRAQENAEAVREERLLSELDDEVLRVYEIQESERRVIERELARRAPHASSSQDTGDTEVLEGELSEEEDLPAIEAEDENDCTGHESVSTQALIEGHSVGARDSISRLFAHYLKNVIVSDDDGIVPLLATHKEPALVVRMREAIIRDLGQEAWQSLDAQAPAFLGTETLEQWITLSSEETREVEGKNRKFPLGFFPWHVQVYRNRPIFWLLSSENFEKGKTRITFRAFLHFLRLKPGTLHRLSEYYLQPLLDLARRESRRTADEASREDGRKARLGAEKFAQEWVNTVAALERFENALEGVIEGPMHADVVPDNAKWLRRTIAEVRGGRDLGHGYQPAIDYGVRVNIAPLAEARLLPRIVLKRLGG